ncbi:hypothetical protein V8C42DRAFT_15946 [Trichoderma barbatum]
MGFIRWDVNPLPTGNEADVLQQRGVKQGKRAVSSRRGASILVRDDVDISNCRGLVNAIFAVGSLPWDFLGVISSLRFSVCTKTGAEVFCGRHFFLHSTCTDCGNGQGRRKHMLGRRLEMLCNHSILLSRAASASNLSKAGGEGGQRSGTPCRTGQGRAGAVIAMSYCMYGLIFSPFPISDRLSISVFDSGNTALSARAEH